MIPLDQQDVFRQGGYFAVNVLSGIRVLSLNTLYFFESNDQVLACNDPKSAGKRHLEWMREELIRAREMQARVYMIGHVPPSTRTFYSSCLADYTQLSIEFRDVIAAHLYGHVNYDHFIVLQEASVIGIEKNSERYITNLKHQYQQVNANDQDKAIVVHIAPPSCPFTIQVSASMNMITMQAAHVLVHGHDIINTIAILRIGTRKMRYQDLS